MVWYSHLFKNFPQFVVVHSVKGFRVVNKAVDVFLEFPCFFYDPVDVGNLLSGSSAFSKSILYIWKFSVHILLKASLKDFELLTYFNVNFVTQVLFICTDNFYMCRLLSFMFCQYPSFQDYKHVSCVFILKINVLALTM